MAQRVNRDFIPVALKAALINNPPPGPEGKLYAEISRSKPAPQGICVANSDGKVLGWVLSFDDDASVPKFLDYAVGRFKDSPNAARPVVAERFMKFPSRKLPDVEDSGRAPEIPPGHTPQDRCPARPALERGALVGRIVGRPLDKEGQPIEKTTRQEEYMEARFDVPPGMQQRFARALAEAAEGKSFAVPPELARLLVSQAYLGQLDVNPLGGRQTGGQTDRETIEFQARLLPRGKDMQSAYITGTSHVAGGPSDVGVRTDGRRWEHRVQLTWEGYLEVRENRIVGLVLTAEGTERLRWGNERFNFGEEPDVAHLMAGHPIDFEGRVRYGLVAQPISDQEAVAPEEADSRPPPSRPADEGRPAKAISPQQRLLHLREAIKHLRAAGAEDLADHLSRQVERMEEALKRERESRQK